METTESENQINESTPDSVRKRIRRLISWLIDWFKLPPRQIPPEEDTAESTKEQSVKDYMSNDIYDFNHSNRKIAILIINSLFLQEEERRYTGHDYTNMKKMFEMMDFDVIVLKNRKSSELKKELKEIRNKQIKENCDCLACVISSHGAEMHDGVKSPQPRHHVVSTADGNIPTNKILQMFNDDNCPNLLGKPRMFFIQACRSKSNPDNDPENKLDKGHILEVNLKQEQVDNDAVPDSMKEKVIGIHVVEFFDIPCYEDYLVMFTSSSGKYGWSGPEFGGWLLYCLRSVFDELDTKYDDFLHILTRVMWKMARDLEIHESHSNPMYRRTKSAAVVYHMLTKEIHLRPKFKNETKFWMLRHFMCWMCINWFSNFIS